MDYAAACAIIENSGSATNLTTFVPTVLYPAMQAVCKHGTPDIKGLAYTFNLCVLYNLDVSKIAPPISRDLRAAVVVADLIIETIRLMPAAWSANTICANTDKIAKFCCVDRVFETPILLRKIISECEHIAVRYYCAHRYFVKSIIHRAVVARHLMTHGTQYKTPGMAVAIKMCVYHNCMC